VTGDCLVAAITSARPPTPAPGDVGLSPKDQVAGGLLKPSIVKVGKLITLDRRLIRRTLGRLPDATVERLLAEVRRFLIEP
jgi:mRNA-degrading endonuclease toxin of MazEF toxin-antitoxin module